MSARPESRIELRIEVSRTLPPLGRPEFRETAQLLCGRFGRVTVVEKDGGGGRMCVEKAIGGEIWMMIST